MKIFCIGTTSYKHMMEEYREDLSESRPDLEIRIPKFDDYNLDELQICKRNVGDIKWADEVHIFWDQRSIGTIFDFGAVFALGKKIKLVFINQKTFLNVMRWYEDPVLYRNETSHAEVGPGSEAPF